MGCCVHCANLNVIQCMSWMNTRRSTHMLIWLNHHQELRSVHHSPQRALIMKTIVIPYTRREVLQQAQALRICKGRRPIGQRLVITRHFINYNSRVFKALKSCIEKYIVLREILKNLLSFYIYIEFRRKKIIHILYLRIQP